MTNMKPMIAQNFPIHGRVAVMSFLLLGLAGCSYNRYLPPDTSSVTGLNRPPLSRQVVPNSEQSSLDYSHFYKDLSFTTMSVQPGDTLSKIAQRYDVPTPSLMALNSSAPPYMIRVGQQVKVPYFKIHSVRAGETLYAIAQVYNVEILNVAHFNGLISPYNLRPGNILKIPQKGGGTTLLASTNMATWKPEQRTPHLQREEIKLTSPKATRTNKDLKVVALDNQKTTAPIVSSPFVADTPVILDGDPIAKADLPPLPKSRYSIKQPPSRSAKSFNWPVKGKVLSAYGRKKNGFHNDGINIKVKPGTPVKAAENGVVSYVGNEMRSFGNLILISHSDGYVTTYGHNAEILVRKGDLVRRGDIIARAGATGDVAIAQLHFEIRKEGNAVNPKRLLARN